MKHVTHYRKINPSESFQHTKRITVKPKQTNVASVDTGTSRSGRMPDVRFSQSKMSYPLELLLHSSSRLDVQIFRRKRTIIEIIRNLIITLDKIFLFVRQLILMKLRALVRKRFSSKHVWF